MTRRLAARVLATIVALVALGAAVGLLVGFDGPPFAVAELATIAGLFALDRLALPIIGRWDRGADGEEHGGAVLDDCDPQAGSPSMTSTLGAATSTTS
jgi:hypothetical protein